MVEQPQDPRQLSKRERKVRRDQASETIRENVVASKTTWPEAEEVAAELESQAAELRRAAAEGELTRQVRRTGDRKRVKLEARRLRLMERDDAYVRGVLSRKEPIQGAYPLDGATQSDELLYILVDRLGMLPDMEALKPEKTYIHPKTKKETTRREMYPPVVLNLLSLLARFLGLENGAEIHEGVLTDERWMALLGFAPVEVAEGHTVRSVELQGKTRNGEGGVFEEAGEMGPARNRADLQAVRGALSYQTVGGWETKLPLEKLATFFNTAVKRAAALGILPKRVEGILDSTNIETPPTFEGAGAVRRKVKVISKNRRPRTVETIVHGFKVWILMDAAIGLPLAMAVATIEKSEMEMARQVVDQARVNLEGHAVLAELAVDRGFLDGDFLWWLKNDRSIDWVCPSKEKMLVTTEARDRVNSAILKAREKVATEGVERWEEPLETAKRLGLWGVNIEDVHFCLHEPKPRCEPLVIANVKDLYDTDFYGPGGSASSRVNSKNYRPTPLQATVVLNWPDRCRSDLDDAQQNDEENRGPVVLLSPIAEPQRRRFDRYDRRSLIENMTNREGKQHFSLAAPLARTETALHSGVCFSLVALLCWRVVLVLDERDEPGDKRAEPLGIHRYRRFLHLTNKHKVLVYVDCRYTIMLMDEMLSMLGVLKL